MADDDFYGDPFVIMWEDGTFTTASNRAISDMHDMADCDAMEGVKSVHAVDENGELAKVVIGPPRSRNSDFDSVYYATAPIMAGTRRVGTVYYSDHLQGAGTRC